jgi:type IV secretory pathway VirB4 component
VKLLEAETFNQNTKALYDNAEKMNHTALIITLKANSREALRNAESHVRVSLESNRVYYEFPETRHLETYLAAQPYPFWYEKSWCELFSYHTALLMPTRNPNSRTSDEGLLFGEDLKTGKPIQINLKALAAQHLFWSGSTGTGKTYSMFLLLMRAYSMLKKRIIFITPKNDPGTSHRKVAEYFGKSATIIDLGPSTTTQKRHVINPMEIFYERGLKNDEAEGRYYSHLNILLKFFDVLLLSDVPNKSNMTSYLIRTIVEVYEKKGIRKDNIATWKNWPVLLDLYHIWEREAETNPTAKALLNKSEMIKFQWNYLNVQSDIDISADFIVIDTSGIDNSSDRLQDAFNVLVTSIMSMRFKNDVDRETIIAVDEAAIFLRDKALSLFLLRTLTQGRSQGISLWLATQQTGDLAKADLEAEFKTNISVNIVMGGMRSDNIDHVAKFYKFDEYTRNLLLGCGKGEGLILLNDQAIPVKFKATDLEHSIIKGTVKGNKVSTDYLLELVDPALSDLITEHGICFNSWVKGDSSVLVGKGFKSQRIIDAIDGKACQVWVKQVPENMSLDHFAVIMRLAVI